jgi:hypothetical protein
MHDSEIHKWLKELTSVEFFKAQIALENDQISRYLKRITSLDLSNDKLALEYAELRGALRSLQDLQAIRKTITNSPSSVKGE